MIDPVQCPKQWLSHHGFHGVPNSQGYFLCPNMLINKYLNIIGRFSVSSKYPKVNHAGAMCNSNSGNDGTGAYKGMHSFIPWKALLDGIFIMYGENSCYKVKSVIQTPSISDITAWDDLVLLSGVNETLTISECKL